MDTVDLPRSMQLADLAREFADAHLKPEGAFLTKLFMGEGFDAYVQDRKRHYVRVVMRKPAASRQPPAEVYRLAAGAEAEQ